MFNVQNEQDLESFTELWMGFEIILIELVHHVEEIFNIAEVLGRHVVLSANPVPECVCCNSGHIAN